MRSQSITLLVAAVLLAVAASPALAVPPVPVPGPVAGAGLGYLVIAGVIAGGYYLVRRWRGQSTRE
jgi:hypothetical protein